MSLAALLNRPMTLVQRGMSSDVDEFGNVVPVETLVPIVGELQQTRMDEPLGSGELSDTHWILFVPAGTPLGTGDAIVADGQVYELVGDPWQARNPRTQVASHIECRLRRTAASGDEITGS